MTRAADTAARARLYTALQGSPLVDQLSKSLPTWDGLEVVEEGLPPWWSEGGNRLLMPPGWPAPSLSCDPNNPPRDGLVVCAARAPPALIMTWGAQPLVIIGEGSRLPNAQIYCGPGAILFGDRTSTTWGAEMDVRNGGLIFVGADGLWGSRVRLQTDDMHAIRDREGRRLNRFGGVIVIDRHTWLASDVLVLGDSRIGSDVVVGARSLVKGVLGEAAVYAGSPARRIRSDTTWSFEDTP